MKTTMSAMITGCLMLLLGTMAFAADAVGSAKLPTKDQHGVDQSKVSRNQKLQAWVDSIKPAAGPVEPAAHPANEYWRQSVRRENRGSAAQE